MNLSGQEVSQNVFHELGRWYETDGKVFRVFEQPRRVFHNPEDKLTKSVHTGMAEYPNGEMRVSVWDTHRTKPVEGTMHKLMVRAGLASPTPFLSTAPLAPAERVTISEAPAARAEGVAQP
jgi:hypothetical protein